MHTALYQSARLACLSNPSKYKTLLLSLPADPLYIQLKILQFYCFLHCMTFHFIMEMQTCTCPVLTELKLFCSRQNRVLITSFVLCFYSIALFRSYLYISITISFRSSSHVGKQTEAVILLLKF